MASEVGSQPAGSDASEGGHKGKEKAKRVKMTAEDGKGPKLIFRNYTPRDPALKEHILKKEDVQDPIVIKKQVLERFQALSTGSAVPFRSSLVSSAWLSV